MVYQKSLLDAGRQHLAGGEERPGVVDQHVQARPALTDGRRGDFRPNAGSRIPAFRAGDEDNASALVGDVFGSPALRYGAI